jgi:hypothetical protein
MHPGEVGWVWWGLKRKWTARGSRGAGSRQVKQLKGLRGLPEVEGSYSQIDEGDVGD